MRGGFGTGAACRAATSHSITHSIWIIRKFFLIPPGLLVTLLQLIKVTDVSDTKSTNGRLNKAKFTNVGRVLDDVVRGLGLDRRMKEQALRQMWPTLVGEPFHDKTRVLFIDSEGNLVVSVRDGSTAQELTFAKRSVLTKIRPAVKALGLSIKGMRFDLKHYFDKIELAMGSRADTNMNNDSSDAYPTETPDEDELNRIELSDREQREIDELSVALRAAGFVTPGASEQSESRSQRIAKAFERQLRLINWRHSKNFPSCSKCNYPTTNLHTKIRLCAECYLEEQATIKT